jgi:hypothetical protein
MDETEAETGKANFVAPQAEETADVPYQPQFVTMLRYVTSSHAPERQKKTFCSLKLRSQQPSGL